MAEFSFDFGGDLEKFRERLNAIPKRAVTSFRRVFRDSLIDVSRAMAPRLRAKSGGDGVAVRTGALRRSEQIAIDGDSLSNLTGTIRYGGSAAPYAVAQERGAEIRPTHSRYLAIPAAQGLTRGGVARNPYLGSANVVNLKTKGGGTFVIKSKRAGNLLVMQRSQGRKGAPKLIAVLVPRVRLTAKLGFERTWRLLERARLGRLYFALQEAFGGAE